MHATQSYKDGIREGIITLDTDHPEKGRICLTM